jgi:hypothetical protein
MTKAQLLELLIELFPRFRAQWDDEENNLSRQGDDFTAHGICAEFSSFFIKQGFSAGPLTIGKLFNKIEELVANDPEDHDPVANALCTCFLENIAQTEAGEKSLVLMGPASRKYFEHWHGKTEKQ